jgi:hypothetical protein
LAYCGRVEDLLDRILEGFGVEVAREDLQR